MPTLSEQIAAKEAELAAARAAVAPTSGPTFSGSSRRKSFAVRVDADIRRTAERFATVERLEHELAVLRLKAKESETLAVLDLSRLPYAAIVRTRYSGWMRVVKVNAKSVKVAAAPGMDDLIKISQIVDFRERTTASANSATRNETA